MHSCPHCSSARVRRSRGGPAGPLLKLFGFRRYHCGECGRSFVRFRSRGGEPSEELSEPGAVATEELEEPSGEPFAETGTNGRPVVYCPHCDGLRVLRSRFRGLEVLLALLLLRVYRCEVCRVRFYRFCLPWRK